MTRFSPSLRHLCALLALAVAATASSVKADTVIDQNSNWDGNINNGWLGIGQSLSVPTNGDDILKSFTVYADSAFQGYDVDWAIYDALNGGSSLVPMSSFNVNGGANVLNINHAFTPGSEIYVEFDYIGYNNLAFDFSATNAYAGGSGSFGSIGNQDQLGGIYSLRFIADFTGKGSVSAPDAGATSMILGLGLAGLAAVRRKFQK